MIILAVFSTRYNLYTENKSRKETGKYNGLPLKFKRGRALFPVFERFKYYLFSANQKVGKSKLVDDLFVYYPIEMRIKGKPLFTKVLYFSLEETEDLKGSQADCHFLYDVFGLRVSPKELKSLSCDCPQTVLNKLYDPRVQSYIKDLEENVTYISDVKNPTGIYKEIKKWMETIGHHNYIEGLRQDPITNEWIKGQIINRKNPYTLNNPETFPIVIIDNFANLSTERGWDLRQTIEKMSKYCIELSQLGPIIVAVQHQAQAQESLENLKYSQIVPTVNGLGDAKTTARDAFATFGLFSPFRFQLQNHLGYDVTKFKDYLRFLYVISDRDGAVGTIIPLLFKGDISKFEELPKPLELEALEELRKQLNTEEEVFEKTFQIHNQIDL